LSVCSVKPGKGKNSKRLKETGNGVLNQVFVRSGIKAASPLKAIKGQLFLGQENFIEEITRKQRYLTRPALEGFSLLFFSSFFFSFGNIKS